MELFHVKRENITSMHIAIEDGRIKGILVYFDDNDAQIDFWHIDNTRESNIPRKQLIPFSKNPTAKEIGWMK